MRAARGAWVASRSLSASSNRSGMAWPSGLGRELPEAVLDERAVLDRGRRAREGVLARLGLGKGNDLADVLLAREDGGQPVGAERETAVWRRAVLERAEQEAEAVLGLLVAQADGAEDALLDVGAV